MKACVDEWFDRVAALPPSPCVLEIGTRRWKPDHPTTHRERILAACPGAVHVGLDVMPGDDVDVVADVHELGRLYSAPHFDAVLCLMSLEHFRRPWLAVQEIAKVTRKGGLGVFVTHQTFPVHGYPQDYFRFSTEAMRELFAPDHGWEVLRCEYEFPCRIIPTTNRVKAIDWNFEAEAWLNVAALVRRI